VRIAGYVKKRILLAEESSCRGGDKENHSH
jgi:hypothetical protein